MVQRHQFSCHSSLVVHYDHVEVERENDGPSERGQAGPRRDGRLRSADSVKHLTPLKFSFIEMGDKVG